MLWVLSCEQTSTVTGSLAVDLPGGYPVLLEVLMRCMIAPPWNERSMPWSHCLVPPAILWLTFPTHITGEESLYFIYTTSNIPDKIRPWFVALRVSGVEDTQVLYDGVSVRLDARFTSGSGKRTLRHFRSDGTRRRDEAELMSIANSSFAWVTKDYRQ